MTDSNNSGTFEAFDDSRNSEVNQSTYKNPIWSDNFPDPFVLKFCGEYWAYCTGIRSDGRAFGIMHSKDLLKWEPLPSALDLLPGENPCYWAPEVTYDNGIFYLYYSVGNEENMHIRVATARTPVGPFTDSGKQLTEQQFAIDPHVFVDSDTRRYIFFANYFIE
jgi:arabinan endo-1,5-alpha-L-arabinosidase